MKLGSSLQSVIERVDQQSRSARDFIAHSRHLRLALRQDVPSLVLDDGSGALPFGITDVVHDQIAAALDIPVTYYNRMRIDHPELMATNVNSWLSRSDQRRLVRTSCDGVPHVRALLSDRYRPLDNPNLLAAVLPTLQERNVKIVSTEVTERRLYLKALNERLTGEIRVGQTVMAGVAISNSEIGLGALEVRGLVYTLACTNGALLEDVSMRRHHVGRRHGGDDENIQHLLSDETRLAADRVLFLKLRDVTRAALDESVWRQQLGKLQAAARNEIPAEALGRVVEVTARRFNLSGAEGEAILAHLQRSADYSQWGLSSAITRHSQDLDSYDRATDLERIGGNVIELSGGAWSNLVSAN